MWFDKVEGPRFHIGWKQRGAKVGFVNHCHTRIGCSALLTTRSPLLGALLSGWQGRPPPPWPSWRGAPPWAAPSPPPSRGRRRALAEADGALGGQLQGSPPRFHCKGKFRWEPKKRRVLTQYLVMPMGSAEVVGGRGWRGRLTTGLTLVTPPRLMLLATPSLRMICVPGVIGVPGGGADV